MRKRESYEYVHIHGVNASRKVGVREGEGVGTGGRAGGGERGGKGGSGTGLERK